MEDKSFYDLNNSKLIENNIKRVTQNSAEIILGTTAWKILKILRNGPQFSKDLARICGISDQSIYYHLRRLIKRELVKVFPESYEDVQEQRIIHINRYQLTANSFLFDVPHDNQEINVQQINHHYESNSIVDSLPFYLQPFNRNLTFDGWIVPGSPLRHGSYNASAADGHFAAPLAFLMGKFLDYPTHFIMKLDTEIKKEKKISDNLILLGGPFVNTVISEINDILPVKFLLTKESGLKVQNTGKEIYDELLGVIQLIPNPYNNENSILIIGGPKKRGTEAAIIAITQFLMELETEFNRTGSYCIIKGRTDDFDEVSGIEILKY